MTEEKTARDHALIAARAADSKKAIDIVIQEVSNLLIVTDYFVIATGMNDRQVEAIADEVEEKLHTEAGIKPIGREGYDERTWVLLDYGDLVVHVFQPQTRDFYRLETLWNDAPIIDVKEAGIESPEYSERIAKLLSREASVEEKTRIDSDEPSDDVFDDDDAVQADEDDEITPLTV